MEKRTKPQKPIEQILSSALIIWVNNQCDYIKDIKVNLEIKSFIDLLRGHLSGAGLIAKDIIFKNLPIYSAECLTGEIKFKLDFRQTKVILREKFNLEGIISFTERNLNDLLVSKEWAWLGIYLSKELIGTPNFKNIQIDGNLFKISGFKPDNGKICSGKYSVIAREGKLILHSELTNKDSHLPMDNAIQINKVSLEHGLLTIYGNSIVRP